MVRILSVSYIDGFSRPGDGPDGEPAAVLHPSIASIVSGVRERKLALADSGEKADLYIQCQLGANSPVLRESSVRTAHIDNPKKIYPMRGMYAGANISSEAIATNYSGD